MKKEIKDCLHFYLGCECVDDTGKKGRLSGIDLCQKDNSITMLTVRYSDELGDFNVFNDNEEMDRVKPILRSLSDMTEEEGKEVGWQETKAKKVELTFEEFKQDLSEYMFFTPDEFYFLLKQGFDLFQLIEPDLAIDAKTLK